jgi:hypothetical protein
MPIAETDAEQSILALALFTLEANAPTVAVAFISPTPSITLTASAVTLALDVTEPYASHRVTDVV